MLENIALNKSTLVIDIETVPQYPSFEELNEIWQKLWSKKMRNQINDQVTASDVYNRAGIYAEFGKIICISTGFYSADQKDKLKFHIKSFASENEKDLLHEFSELLNKSFNDDGSCLIAHNGKEFDFPFIARRCLINGLPIPAILDNSGKKPWELRCFDTMEMWKFGDFKNYTSLDLLAAVFGIDSPKDEMDGSQVWSTYWIDKDLEKIKRYCQKDVLTAANLILKFKGKELLMTEDIEYRES